MTEPVISVRELSKVFRIYHRPADMLWELLSGKMRHREFWGLRDVSFDVRSGEILGLIGHNGAGKSTLLKILAGTLDSSSGEVITRGKVAAILELGAGFHPELTGRDNIVLGAMCLGLSRQAVAEQAEGIIEFAELGEFIDRPFKTYSSGMKSRLTFATAMSVDPDVLIVDEALSVGDAKFQRKSFSRLEEFRARGKTIIIVSHALNTIVSFCDRAILLHQGQVLQDGDPKEVTQYYHNLLFGKGQSTMSSSAAASTQHIPAPLAVAPPVCPVSETRYGTGEIIVDQLVILDPGGQETTLLRSGESYTIRAVLRCHTGVPAPVVGFVIRNKKGIELFGVDTQWGHRLTLPAPASGDRLVASIDLTMWLANGDYFLTAAVADENGQKYDLRYDMMHFKVVGTEKQFAISLVNLQPHITVTLEPAIAPCTSAEPVP